MPPLLSHFRPHQFPLSQSSFFLPSSRPELSYPLPAAKPCLCLFFEREQLLPDDCISSEYVFQIHLPLLDVPRERRLFCFPPARPDIRRRQSYFCAASAADSPEFLSLCAERCYV